MTLLPRFRFNITTKFVTYLLFIAVIPLMVVGATSYLTSFYVIEEQAEQYSVQIAYDQARYLDLQLRQSASLLDSIASDEAIVGVMLETSSTAEQSFVDLVARERVGAILNNYLDLNGPVGIMIITQDGRFFNVGDTLESNNLNEEITQAIVNNPDLTEAHIYWLGLLENINAASAYGQVLTAVRPITRIRLDTGGNEILGYIVASYDPQTLAQPLQTETSFRNVTTNVIVVDGNNRIAFHNNAGLIGVAINDAFVDQLQAESGVLTTSYNDLQTVISYHRSEESGWLVLSLTPVEALLQPARVIGLSAIVIFGFSLSFAMLFAWFFTRDVVKPIQELTARFKESQQGPETWHMRLETKNNDEIGELIHWFNAFMESLQGRAQAEGARRQSEQQYRLIFESVNDGLLVFDWETKRLHEANTAVCEMFGYDLPTLLTLDPSQLFSPNDRPRFNDYLEHLKTASGDMTTLTGQHQTGREIIVEVHGNSLNFHGQKQILTIMRNVTERLQAEQAMHHTQKLESLGLMAGGIAHDFNNLLVAMLAQNSLALNKLDPEHPAVRHIHKAVNAAERAADLTRQMLAYSGKGHFEITAIDLNQLIRENVDLLRAALPKQISLTMKLAPDAPLIEGDKGQLQQVVMNIVLNAAEATDHEHGEVQIETYLSNVPVPSLEVLTRQSRIEFLPTSNGRHLVFMVADNGHGMDEATLARIFDPFFTTKFTGRGLGLAAVLGIVKGHGGTVRVHSKPNVGTRFELYFPLLERHLQREPLPPPPHQLNTGQVTSDCTILIIDDEDTVRDVTIDILMDANYQILEAANGTAGLALLHQQASTTNICALLLDYSMPGLNGLETLRLIRRDYPTLPVIMFSGYAQPADFSAMNQYEDVSFLMKPFTPPQLLTAVAQAIFATPQTST